MHFQKYTLYFVIALENRLDSSFNANSLKELLSSVFSFYFQMMCNIRKGPLCNLRTAQAQISLCSCAG